MYLCRNSEKTVEERRVEKIRESEMAAQSYPPRQRILHIDEDGSVTVLD